MIILTFLSGPFEWVLQQLTQTFGGIGVLQAIGAFGLAVIVLTVCIRAVLFPIFSWQLKNQRRIQAEQRMVAPQINELRKKYKKEPQKLSAEMNKVYREHGISPFSSLTGCLPALVQMPVLVSLYTAIRFVACVPGVTGCSASLLNSIGKGFLWIPDVTQSAQQVVGGNWGQILLHPTLLILPLIAGAFTFAQSRMMMPPLRPDMTDQERSMANVSKQMSIIFPGMIFIFGLILPQGLAIYWVTGTMFMVLQQFIVVGWGGLKVPAWFPGAGRVTKLSYPRPDATKARAGTATASSPALTAPKRAPDVDKNGKNGSAPEAGGTARDAAKPGEEAGGAADTPPARRTQTAQRALARAEARSRSNPRRRRRR